MQTTDLRTSVLRAMIGSGLSAEKKTFGIQVPKRSAKITHNGRGIEDFLYGFAIHYGILVKEAFAKKQKAPDREICLRLFCERYYKEGNLTEHTFATVSKIINCKGAKTQLTPGVWVSAALYVFDAWFGLIIGKAYNTYGALDIPDSFLRQVDEHSTVYSYLEK